MLPNELGDWSAMRRRVYLLRHGEVDYFDAQGKAVNPDCVTLNDLGHKQAAAVGEALAAIPFDLAVSTGLARTEQTAQLVLARRGVPMENEPRLREIVTGKMSDFERADQTEVARIMLGVLSAAPMPESQFFGGETFASCSARVLAAWSDLLARKDWQNVLVVGHGIVNRLLICHLLAAPLASIGRIEQDAGCVNLIEVDSAGWPLVRIVNASFDDPGKKRHTLSTLETLFRQYLRGKLTPPQK